MSKIPTGEDFLQDSGKISHFYDDKTSRTVCFSEDVQTAMKEFAKLHVEAALKANHKLHVNSGSATTETETINSYPLSNIK